jgi:putative transposase
LSSVAPASDCYIIPIAAAQYAAHTYRRLLHENGMRCSMSRKGNCWDNAPMESFFGSMKTELDIDDTTFETRRQARVAIFSFLESFYNRRRLHSAIGYRSPDQWERIAAAAQVVTVSIFPGKVSRFLHHGRGHNRHRFQPMLDPKVSR